MSIVSIEQVVGWIVGISGVVLGLIGATYFTLMVYRRIKNMMKSMKSWKPEDIKRLRKKIADFVLLIGGVLVALRLLFFTGWVNKLFPSVFPTGTMDRDTFLAFRSIAQVHVLYQALGLAILTGVSFYLLRKNYQNLK